MKNKIDNLIYELEDTIQIKDLEFTEVLVDLAVIINILESGFEKLKLLISDFCFEDKSDEIHFFKEVKPRLFSKLIYFRKKYQLELNRPVSNYETVKTYLEKEHEQINLYCSKNAEFIQYYRSGKTILDEYYFLRGRREMELNLESFYFERDPKFSTNFDFKVSKLLANE